MSRQEQISRLIDLELIRQELTSFPLDPGEQSGIEARVEELKEGYAEIGGLAPLLRRLGLQAEELQDYLRLQASILRFVNLRFRPFVSVSQDEVRAYYRDKLAPKLQAAGAPVPPVEEVSAKIEDVLKEEKVNAALDDWIKELRAHSRIEFLSGQAAIPQGELQKSNRQDRQDRKGSTSDSSRPLRPSRFKGGLA